MRSYEQLLYACGLADVADSPWSRSPMNVSKAPLEGIGGRGGCIRLGGPSRVRRKRSALTSFVTDMSIFDTGDRTCCPLDPKLRCPSEKVFREHGWRHVCAERGRLAEFAMIMNSADGWAGCEAPFDMV